MDYQPFYNALAKEHGVPAEDVERAIKIALIILKTRNSISNLLEEKTKRNLESKELTPEGRPKTLGIHVSDTIRTEDVVGGP